VQAVSPTSIDLIFDRVPHGKRTFVKMDIEGSEYGVIPQILSHSTNIVGMIVEFHNTDTQRSQFEDSIHACLRHFEIVHIHANNWGELADDGLPNTLEVTFMNKGYCQESALRRDTLPIAIDQPCHAGRPEIFLHFQQ
jgi:hypothetical protein